MSHSSKVALLAQAQALNRAELTEVPQSCLTMAETLRAETP